MISPSDLTTVACQPALGTVLEAAAVMTCHGTHTVQQDELESGQSSYTISVQAENLEVVGGVTRELLKAVALPAVRLPAVASLSAAINMQSCQKPTSARKGLSS